MEPPEEFYDSLDEDSNYGSLDNESINDEQLPFLNSDNKEEDQHREIVQLHFSQSNKQILPFVDATDAKDDVIPFYEKDLNRSEMESTNDAECSKNKSKKDPARRKPNNPFIDEKMKSKSYLHMFHAKIGTEISKNKSSSSDSSKATCLDETPKSFVTCQDFEVNSVYLKSEDFSEAESDSPFQNVDDKQDCPSVSSLDSKLCSVSEQCLNVHDTDTTKSKKKCSKSFTEKIPLLGGLGPEIQKDKLDLLKRRQQYGLKASQKNRIKMIEKRLLENLQREMKECGNINI